jgi:hypothetical protein
METSGLGLPPDYPYAGQTEVGKPLRYVSPLYMAIILPTGFLVVWGCLLFTHITQ